MNDAAAITVSGRSNLMQNNRASEPIAGAAFVDTNLNCDANRWINNTGSGNQACVQWRRQSSLPCRSFRRS